MLWGALNTAAMAMNAMGSDMGTISQNISNVNTAGYKAARTQFQTTMSEQISSFNDGSGSSPKGLVSYGVSAYTQNLISAQGSFLQAGQFSDLAINGQGFFMVAPPTTTGGVPASTAAPSYFTRNGAFQEKAGANGQQYLTDGSGNYLLGWQGGLTTAKISTGSSVSPIYIPAAATVTRNGVTTQVDMPANATTAITLGANVTTDNRNNQPPGVESIPLNAFDSLSKTHPITLQFSPVINNTNAATTTTTDTSTSPATVTTTGPTNSVTQTSLDPDVWNLKFATTESGATITGTTGGSSTSSTSSTAGTVTTQVSTTTTTDQGTTVTFNSDGTIASPKTLTFAATWADGQTSTITIDISGMTQYGGSAKSVVNYTSQDGYPDGQLQSLSFDGNGVLTGSYSNGKGANLAQVGMARFPAPDSLNPVSGTLFQQTVASGAPLIDTASNLGSSVMGGTLESSTVDIGTEFTNMILAQKAYGLNSEVMKTADQMTQTARDLQT